MGKRKLVIADMHKSMPPGARDKSIKYHKTDNLPLWEAGDIDLSSVDWSRRDWIFAEAAEDRGEDAERAAYTTYDEYTAHLVRRMMNMLLT